MSDRARPFLVDRPTGETKIRVYVPVDSAVDEDGFRELNGARTKAELVSERRGYRCYRLSIRYTSATVAWLRSLPGSGGVKLRTARSAADHCTPQCEGAWRAAERGEYHDDWCTCPCGGYRHNEGNPWWARFEILNTAQYDAEILETRFLPPLNGRST